MTILRLIGILLTVLRHRLDRLLPAGFESPWYVRFLLGLLRLLPAPEQPPEVSLRLMLEGLSPIFVKFGQILSTRRDLFSKPVADELQKLQDRVTPFDSALARSTVEAALQAPVDSVFAHFETDPLASASVAQVHAATLATGEDVVVKIIRPGIERLIKRDIAVMYMLARLLERVWSEGRRLHPVEIVRDYERTIMDELNLNLEAANTMRLGKNWNGSGKLYVPHVYFDFTRDNVMVMERIYGLTAADIEGMQARNVDMKKLAHLGVEIFFTQVFEDNFFHADMHPGNVFVDVSDPANPTYIALDCAIIGSLTEDDKTYLARNLLAFFRQDYFEVARLHVESGWVPADTDIREFESVIRAVCDPVFQKPISEISFGRVLVSLFQTARRFNMEVQPQLVLLQKTLLNIEGMGRQLYPQLDLWETAAPYMERWMENRMGISGLLSRLGKNAPQLLEILPELPTIAVDTARELRALSRNNQAQNQLLQDLRGELQAQASARRRSRMGGLALLAAAAALAFPLASQASPEQILAPSILGSLGVYWVFIRP